MPYFIQYQVKDNDNDSSNTGWYVPEGLTLAQYAEAAIEYAQVMFPFLFGVIQTVAKMKVPVDLSGLTGNVASADSDVEQVAAFEFLTPGGNTSKLNIPCLNELDMLDFTDELDTSDPNIAAIIAAMEDGLLVNAVQVQPSNIADEDFIATLYARAETRNSGRRRR